MLLTVGAATPLNVVETCLKGLRTKSGQVGAGGSQSKRSGKRLSEVAILRFLEVHLMSAVASGTDLLTVWGSILHYSKDCLLQAGPLRLVLPALSR